MLLFEFEQLDEGIAQVKNIKGICVLISDHALDRMSTTRTSVTPEEFRKLLNRIPDVRNKFKPLEDRSMFKIWSKSQQLGLGMVKFADKDGYPRVYVGTVIDKPPFENVNDTILYVG